MVSPTEQMQSNDPSELNIEFDSAIPAKINAIVLKFIDVFDSMLLNCI